IAELGRCSLIAIAAAGRAGVPPLKAEQRLTDLLNDASLFLRRGVPRDFGTSLGGTPVLLLELADGYHPDERARHSQIDVGENEREHIDQSAARSLHRARECRESAAREFELRKRSVDSALRDCRSLAAACGEFPAEVVHPPAGSGEGGRQAKASRAAVAEPAGPKPHGNRIHAGSSKPQRRLKNNLYEHIQREKRPGEGEKSLAERLQRDKNIVELATDAGVARITEDVVKAAIEAGRRLARAKKKATE
ncbi:MAG: hypothetical protein K2V38_03145, partial [Gemmataceae bacterium]|nr:hypothetical protein [Gemmataceae bacterium]